VDLHASYSTELSTHCDMSLLRGDREGDRKALLAWCQSLVDPAAA
jgi:hypothetical protein